MWATRGAHNPNLNVAFTNACTTVTVVQFCPDSIFAQFVSLPLRMYGMQRMLFPCASYIIWPLDDVKLTHTGADQSKSGMLIFDSMLMPFMSHWMPFPDRILSQAIARVLFVCSSLTSSVERQSYLFVLYFKRGAASVLLVLCAMHINKLCLNICLIHSNDILSFAYYDFK